MAAEGGFYGSSCSSAVGSQLPCSNFQTIDQVTHQSYFQKTKENFVGCVEILHEEIVFFPSNWCLFAWFKCGIGCLVQFYFLVVELSGSYVCAKRCKGEGIRTPLGHQAQASMAPLKF
jgi:hypothetical protein